MIREKEWDTALVYAREDRGGEVCMCAYAAHGGWMLVQVVGYLLEMLCAFVVVLVMFKVVIALGVDL